MRPALWNSGVSPVTTPLARVRDAPKPYLSFRYFPASRRRMNRVEGPETIPSPRSVVRSSGLDSLCQFISHLISQSAHRFAAVRCTLPLVTAGQSRGFSFSGDLEARELSLCAWLPQHAKTVVSLALGSAPFQIVQRKHPSKNNVGDLQRLRRGCSRHRAVLQLPRNQSLLAVPCSNRRSFLNRAVRQASMPIAHCGAEVVRFRAEH